MINRAAADPDPPPVYLCTRCDRRVLVEFDTHTINVVIKRGVCFKWCREPVYLPANSNFRRTTKITVASPTNSTHLRDIQAS